MRESWETGSAANSEENQVIVFSGSEAFRRHMDVVACFRLAEAVIKGSIQTPNTTHANKPWEWENAIQNRIYFAQHSPLVTLYADLAEIDDNRLRQRIIEINVKRSFLLTRA